MERDKSATVGLQVRFPPDLVEKVKRSAKENGVSYSAEINNRLTEGFIRESVINQIFERGG